MKNKREKILVSACLLGIECRYDGKSKLNKKILKLAKEKILIPVCPEIFGGLTIPRRPCGIYGGVGKNVIEGKATVRTVKEGEDVTKQFLKGAKETLKIAKLFKIKAAILKNGSPSCGVNKTWQLDKKFKNHKVKGKGVTAALLKTNKIKTISEENL